jgi:hypothetical protein
VKKQKKKDNNIHNVKIHNVKIQNVKIQLDFIREVTPFKIFYLSLFVF